MPVISHYERRRMRREMPPPPPPEPTRKARGLCRLCDAPRTKNAYCRDHDAERKRERYRRIAEAEGRTVKEIRRKGAKRQPYQERQIGFVWGGVCNSGGPLAHKFRGRLSVCGRCTPIMFVELDEPGTWPVCQRCEALP